MHCPGRKWVDRSPGEASVCAGGRFDLEQSRAVSRNGRKVDRWRFWSKSRIHNPDLATNRWMKIKELI